MINLEILTFIKEYQKLRDAKIRELPYQINLVDELHADEDAHTRILTRLLNFKIDNELPILNSFIRMAAKKCSDLNNVINDSLRVSKQTEFIDCLIEGHDYSIIIENKINWAKDQDKQIENYIKKVIKHGIVKGKIFVIYLTDTGAKMISDCSFTDFAKKILSYGTDNNRFIESNYKEDILPWLKKEILPEIRYKDDLLISFLKQYIDYLDGRFQLRENERMVNREMNKVLEKKLELLRKSPKEKIKTLNFVLSELLTLENDISNYNNEIIEDEIFSIFSEISKKYFCSTNNKISIDSG